MSAARAAALLADGVAHRDAGRWAEADESLTAADRALEEPDGPDGPDSRVVRARVARVQGSLWRARGCYGDARVRLRDALDRAEAELGPEADDVVALLNDLAVVGKFSGDFDEAERYYRRALAIGEAREEPDLDELATLHHNLGGLAHARGDMVAAEAPARQAVALRERVRGSVDPDDPVLAADRAALAPILDALGLADEAEALLHGVLGVFERLYGPEHHEVAVTLHNLASLIHRSGRPEDAAPLYERALATKRAVLGPEHPELAPTLHNLAVAVHPADPARSRDLLDAAIHVLAGRVAPDHPILVASREQLRAISPQAGATTRSPTASELAG